MNQHEQDTTDVLRGPKANARRNWDGNWILESAKTRKPLLISTKEQISNMTAITKLPSNPLESP